MTTRSLLLLAHGSAHDRRSGAPVRASADRLRRTGRFHEVQVAFWKEGPPPKDVLESLTGSHVFIVPMFLADGYYARDVMPRALGMASGVTRRGAQCIHYCPPVGSHPAMVRIAARRACNALARAGVAAIAADLILAGHGTERSPTSAGTVRAGARVLHDENVFRSVRFGLLDEAPRIEDVVGAAEAQCVVVVPWFLAEGWHTRHTLPERLASAAARAARAGGILLVTRPPGTARRVDALVLDLVRSSNRAQMKRQEMSCA